MEIRYTDSAFEELEEILAYADTAYPDSARSIEHALDRVLKRVATLPLSAPGVTGQPNVRVMHRIGKFPYMLFYEVAGEDEIRILHLRHAVRKPWGGKK